MVPLAEIDYKSGMRELDEMEAHDNEVYKQDTALKRAIGYIF